MIFTSPKLNVFAVWGTGLGDDWFGGRSSDYKFCYA